MNQAYFHTSYTPTQFAFERFLAIPNNSITLTRHLGPGALFTRARDVQTGLPGESEWRGSRLAQQRERDALCMVGHKRERVLGRVGRAVNAAARDFAREAAQLENGGGREAAAERLVLVEQQVEVVALDTFFPPSVDK